MAPFRLMRAGPGDWERVRLVRLRALADAPDAFGRTWAEEEAREPASWREQLGEPGRAAFLALGGEAPVGLAFGAPYEGRAGAAGLFGLWVDPGWRGRGAGDALIQAVVAWARAAGFERVLLEVGDGNVAAIRLYERHGFVATGRRGTLPPPRQHVLEHEREHRLGGGAGGAPVPG